MKAPVLLSIRSVLVDERLSACAYIKHKITDRKGYVIRDVFQGTFTILFPILLQGCSRVFKLTMSLVLFCFCLFVFLIQKQNEGQYPLFLE